MRTLTAFVLILFMAAGARAQVLVDEPPPEEGGYTQIGDKIQKLAPPPIEPLRVNVRDYREDMRKLITDIARYARKQKREFAIVVEDGLELLLKEDEHDPEVKNPAVAYMRSIDGVLHNALFHGVREIGRARKPETKKKYLKLLKIAKANGLNRFIVDYAKNPKKIEASYRQAAKLKLTPFVADAMGLAQDSIPAYPRDPFRENPKNVMSIAEAKNFLYLKQSNSFGRLEEFALALAATNFDMVVVDVYHRRRPLTRQAVETLRYKKIGAKRLVLAYINIGAAARYRYYWKDHWREGSPRWIAAPYPGDPDRFFVEFWRPEWKNIVFGNPNSFIYGLLAQGYDGVVLAGADAYRYFEGGMDAVMRALNEDEE